MKSLFYDIKSEPWNADDFFIPKNVHEIYTMLTGEEGRLLRWVTECYFSGAGAICELGTFLGGSTARLAYGLSKNANTSNKKIQCFDRYECAEHHKQQLLYQHGIKPFDGVDILPISKQMLAAFADYIEFNKCDILDAYWDNGPIEVLFIDIAKTRQTNDHVMATFFPHLIPGQSLVIQQDYFHHTNPWVVAQIEALIDCFELVACTRDNSAVFRCLRLPSKEELDRATTANMGYQQLIDYLITAMDRFPSYRHKQHLARSMLTLKSLPTANTAWQFENQTISFQDLDEVICSSLQ
jgi:Methyltransferase domain